jgi:hypothetical protein
MNYQRNKIRDLSSNIFASGEAAEQFLSRAGASTTTNWSGSVCQIILQGSSSNSASCSGATKLLQVNYQHKMQYQFVRVSCNVYQVRDREYNSVLSLL